MSAERQTARQGTSDVTLRLDEHRRAKIGADRPAGRPDPRGYQPVDLLMMAFLLMTSAVLIFSPLDCPGRARLTYGHLVCLAAIAALRFVPRRRRGLPGLLRDFYPFLLMPFLYKSIQYLNQLTTRRYHDAIIVGWEERIFSTQPSATLIHHLPWTALSEYLHLSYLLYIPMIFLIALGLRLSRLREHFSAYATSVVGAFVTCYTVFLFFPVKGPFYFFGPIDPSFTGSFAAPLVHQMLHNAASVGTAFPSSHVAVSVCAWVASRRALGRLSWLVLVVTVGILVGTVYGGFHYAVDVLVGLASGLALGILGPRFDAALRGGGK